MSTSGSSVSRAERRNGNAHRTPAVRANVPARTPGRWLAAERATSTGLRLLGSRRVTGARNSHPFRARSAEVDSGSTQQSASKQELEAVVHGNAIGRGSQGSTGGLLAGLH